jgi:hypothetical protein
LIRVGRLSERWRRKRQNCADPECEYPHDHFPLLRPSEEQRRLCADVPDKQRELRIRAIVGLPLLIFTFLLAAFETR